MVTKPKLLYLTVLAAVLYSTASISGCAPEVEVEPQLVRFAGPEHFVSAEDGLAALQNRYNFQFDEVYEIAMGFTHEALRAGDVDAALGYATDGKIMELELIALIDDKGVFPSRNAAPVAGEEILALYPEIEAAYREIRPHIDNRTMIRLNYLVDIEGYPLDKAVEEWMEDRSILQGDPSREKTKRPVIIGTKGYVEQEILVHIMAVALNRRGIPVEIEAYPAGIRAARAALLNGRIDLYWEYTGAAWREFFDQEPAIDCPDALFEAIREKDYENGLVWLDYAPLDNTHTLLMRREQAVELGIYTISSFARWVRTIQEENYQLGE